jgi:nitrous oxidase accessory protein NosD
LYGPIETRKLIRKVTANTFDSSVLQTNERRINLSSGSGDYKIGELVYEGKTLYTANSSGFVEAWNNTANQIIVTDIAGTLEVGRKLTGAVTNTSYTMSSFVANNNQLMNLTVAPNPSTANANDDFGFTETLEQYPNIT